jgi:GGDEF domain-containing protein
MASQTVLITVGLLSGAARPPRPLRAEINAIVEAPDASVWVGSAKGLYRVAAGASELQAVDAATGSGLANPSVIGLLFDRRQTLWLDTAVTGLHRMTRWDGERATFERISERHGIVTRPFGGNLLEDERGRIWTQMYVYDPATDRLDELTAADGADLGTGWFLAHAMTPDGRLLFGGSRGILVVKPEQLRRLVYAPPLVVSELTIDGQRQPAGRIQDGLDLAPPQRGFSLTFAALDYSDPGRLRYAYRLHGFDTDWIATGGRFARRQLQQPRPRRLCPARACHQPQRHLESARTGHPGAHTARLVANRVVPHELARPAGGNGLCPGAVTHTPSAGAPDRTRTYRARAHRRSGEADAGAAAGVGGTRESSLTDPLTGLRNRRFVALHIEADAALAVREYASHASYGASLRDDAGLIFFLFDIDHFKQVNDERPCGG